MFKFNFTRSKMNALMIAAGLTSVCLTASAHAAGTDNRQYGSYVATAATGRIINVNANTKYVNVDDGETVTFVKDSQQFTWNFETSRGAENMPLSAIAPAGFTANKVQVYVASNPLYRN